MKKELLILFLTLLVFGITLNAPILMAEGEDGTDNSGSSNGASVISTDDDSDDDSEDDDEEEEDEDDEREERMEQKLERERNRERTREKIERNFIAADGSRVEIEREVEVENGKVKVKIKRKITNADGTVVIKVMVIEREGNEIETKVKIKIEGVDGLEVETELEIEDEFEGNESDVKAVMSNGRKAAIKIMPDAASDIALQRLRALSFTKIELKEVRHNNEIRVAYKVEAEKEGRFFGIFKLKLKMNSLIDPETGEVLDIGKPWWAFLVVGEDIEQTVVVEDSQ